MAKARARAIPLLWWIQTITVDDQTLQVARLRVRPFFRSGGPRPRFFAERCWFDSGAPLTVVPFHIHHQRLPWRPLGVQATWAGQVCDLGAIDVWFATTDGATVRGPFSVVAKFARGDPPGDPVPVLLGLNFLLAYQASLALDPPPGHGRIELP